MKSGTTKYLELLEGRSELLQTLIRTEGEWRHAFIALNLHDSERLSADGVLICDRIRALDREIISSLAKGTGGTSAKSSGPGPIPDPVPDPIIDERIRVALVRMAELHLNLNGLNATNLAILKRSKITMNALRNLFNSHAPTYSSPAAASVGTIYEEIV